MREGRNFDETRAISLEVDVMRYPEGSCFIKCGNTHVLCTATIEESVPSFLKHQRKGWVTAEYSMLPRSTHTRMRRDATQNKPNGRSLEIQRLIARSLRAAVDFKALGERQIIIDCDVIQADGGTRTAAVTGGFVALYSACQRLLSRDIIKKNPIKHQIAAISCGIVKNEVMIDLNYEEDSRAMVDANFIMTNDGKIIEIQGSAETEPFSHEDLVKMMTMSKHAISGINKLQKEVLGL